MGISLLPGANTVITALQATLNVSLQPAQLSGVEVDISAFLLTAQGKVRGDQDMIFYGQPKLANGALELKTGAPGTTSFSVDLSRIESSIEKIAFTATIHENRQSFEGFQKIQVNVKDTAQAEVLDASFATQGMKETALILGEFYRHNGNWKFRSIAQGFIGGLKPLAEHFGVDIQEPSSSPSPASVVSTAKPNAAPQPATSSPSASPASPAPVVASPAPSKVSLSKITLDKGQPRINLEKRSAGYGEIKVNLNWNRGEESKGFFSSLLKSDAIDLDLGCLYELQNGHKGVIQSLGGQMGVFQSPPFIHLAGDDRTGKNKDGEWLRINGANWSAIKRILVFAFIYEGAPNWAKTDAVVTLYVPGESDIEIRLTEGTNKLGMCGIALLENVDGAIRVSREMHYTQGHSKLDEAYRWGMRWVSGSK